MKRTPAAERPKSGAPAVSVAAGCPPADRGYALAAAIGLALIVLALYWPVLGNQFLKFDDDTYIYHNPHILAGWTASGLQWASTNAANGNWHPLTWVSHMLDVQWFGVDAWSEHLVNVLWHAANSAVLLLALWYMTGRLWRSILVAAFFALHPLRVESVAWISERKDVLSSFFYFSAVWTYAWYTRRPSSWRRYALVTGLVFLGLMAKPSVVTAPFLFLLLDVWPLRRSESKLVLLREKIPWVFMAAAVSLTTYLAQKKAGTTSAIPNLGVAERVANALVSYVRYLGKLFWPQSLAVVYPYDRYLPSAEVLSAGLLLVLITAAVWFQGRRLPYLRVGWFWFLGTLAPMIGLVQAGWQAYADRYTYLPSIGIVIALVWMIADAVAARPRQRSIAAAVALSVLLLLGFVTFSQLAYWHDDLTLFQHTLAVTTDNPLAEYRVGQDLMEDGRKAEAIPHLRAAIRLAPGFYASYYALGTIRADEGNLEALEDFSQAIRFKSDSGEAYYGRGIVYLETGNDAAAEADLRTALHYGIDEGFSAEAHNELGIIRGRRNDTARAAQEFAAAVRLQPSLVSAEQNLALALVRLGRKQEAIANLESALSATHGDARLAKLIQQLQALPANPTPH